MMKDVMAVAQGPAGAPSGGWGQTLVVIPEPIWLHIAAPIGAELGADYLVESSLRAENHQLRITARLIRVRGQVQIWSDSFDRNTSSILDLQQEISSAIGTRAT